MVVQEPRGEPTPAKSVAITHSTTHPVSKGGDSRIGEIIGKILSAMAATDGGKMCMQPIMLQARFGCINLLGRSLEECLGG